MSNFFATNHSTISINIDFFEIVDKQFVENRSKILFTSQNWLNYKFFYEFVIDSKLSKSKFFISFYMIRNSDFNVVDVENKKQKIKQQKTKKFTKKKRNKKRKKDLKSKKFEQKKIIISIMSHMHQSKFWKLISLNEFWKLFQQIVFEIIQHIFSKIKWNEHFCCENRITKKNQTNETIYNDEFSTNVEKI